MKEAVFCRKTASMKRKTKEISAEIFLMFNSSFFEVSNRLSRFLEHFCLLEGAGWMSALMQVKEQSFKLGSKLTWSEATVAVIQMMLWQKLSLLGFVKVVVT